MNQLRSIVVEDASPPRQGPSLASWYTPGFSDGLGDRLLMFDNTAAASLELLRFKPELGNRPAFEHALRQRLKQFERFSHPSVGRVRSVDWLGAGEGLALISNHVVGRRLSQVAKDARGPSFAMELLRQLTPGLAALQQHGEGVAHGALTAERIVVTPQGRLVIVEHVIGSALESLQMPAGRLQSEFGIALPPGRDRLALDSRTDVVQLALVALSLLIGRPIDPAHYPEKGADLLDEFSWPSRRGASASPRLRGWLERALQLNGRTFATVQDAHDALGDLSEDNELPMASQPRTFHDVHAAAESVAASHTARTPELLDAFASSAESEFPSEVDLVSAGAQPMGLETRRVSWPGDSGKRIEHAAPAAVTPADGVEAPTAYKPYALPSVPRKRFPGSGAQWTIAALAVLVLTEGLAIGWLLYSQRANGSATVPPAQGAPDAAVNGRQAGPPLAPATGAETTSSPASDAEGLAGLPPGVAASRLEVASDPPGARVTVDGKLRGTTPLALTVGAGTHAVVVSDGGSTTTRTITTVAGGTSTLVAALAPAVASAGWVSISVPVELQVLEHGTIIGITSAERLMLPAGRHELEVVSAALGVKQALTVDIQPGKTAKATVTVPNGSLSINALPWATVLLDGQPLNGTTPFANLSVPLGSHEILYKHPQLGERRQTVMVTAKTPIRLVMDLNK